MKFVYNSNKGEGYVDVYIFREKKNWCFRFLLFNR